MANLPRYQCHKIVRALQIKAAFEGNDTVTLQFVEAGYADVVAPAAMFVRYFPKALDYYVVYDNPDGSEYGAASPRDVFEAGYKKLP